MIQERQPRLYAWVPLFSDRAGKASWTFMEKSLLDCALESILKIPQIKQTIVSIDEDLSLEEWLTRHGIEIIQLKSTNDKGDLFCSHPTLQQIVNEIDLIKGLSNVYDGLVVIDILCPLRNQHHVEDAIAVYTSQMKKSRPWLNVFSVSPLQSHYHPKKILKITANGKLDYYDPSGCNIYRRQQLDSDKYYCANNAVLIFDPRSIKNQSLPNREILGHIINEPMVFVKNLQDLEFAMAIYQRLKRQ